jgi:hypothetical protein
MILCLVSSTAAPYMPKAVRESRPGPFEVAAASSARKRLIGGAVIDVSDRLPCFRRSH